MLNLLCCQVKRTIREKPSQIMEVQSLLWEPHGRELGIVATSSYWKSFPNTKYGLNGRTLRVAVLEVCIFIIRAMTITCMENLINEKSILVNKTSSRITYAVR